jgi:hypothetical protein
MNTVGKCSGLMGKLLGHRFEARYDYGAPTILPEYLQGPAYRVIELTKSSRPMAYKHDICARCGMVRTLHSQQKVIS